MSKQSSVNSVDRLPPHSPEGEMGVLGCILLSPNESMPAVRTRFGLEEVFYDLRHQMIWHALCFLHSQGTAIDVITLQAELKNRRVMERMGGIAYLAGLPDAVPSAANLNYYLDIVWEKFLFRKMVHTCTDAVARVYDYEGNVDGLLDSVERDLLNVGKLRTQTGVPPALKDPAYFGEEFYHQWFDRKVESYGYELPFEFPLRYRPGATTLMTGDNGSGKSSMLCLQAVCVAAQLQPGEKIVLASMEMPAPVTLWVMSRQLLGTGRLEKTEENIARIRNALAWLNARVLIYDFLGITDRNQLLNAFTYGAAQGGGKFFILDNLMKVGIADDDYAAQGLFIQAVCNFDIQQKVHTIIVVHENKGDGNVKKKVRGSGQLTDAPDNVISMARNEKKAEKLADLDAKLLAEPDNAQLKMARAAALLDSDGHFGLHKQRYPDEVVQQNARAYLWYDRAAMQYHKAPNQPAINFMMK